MSAESVSAELYLAAVNAEASALAKLDERDARILELERQLLSVRDTVMQEMQGTTASVRAECAATIGIEQQARLQAEARCTQLVAELSKERDMEYPAYDLVVTNRDGNGQISRARFAPVVAE